MHGPVPPVACACVSGMVMYLMLCVLSVHVQLIKELLRDGSHPMTSKPQESFTSCRVMTKLSSSASVNRMILQTKTDKT